MQRNEHRVLIARDSAQAFFHEARHPDMDSLRRRDAFFARLKDHCAYRREGTDLVMELPGLHSCRSADQFSTFEPDEVLVLIDWNAIMNSPDYLGGDPYCVIAA